MQPPAQPSLKQQLTIPYQWLVIGAGVLISSYYASRLPLERIDLRFLLLASLTLFISSRISVKVPRFNTNVTISDTFIFLAILLYGGALGILLSAAEGLSASTQSRDERSQPHNKALKPYQHVVK